MLGQVGVSFGIFDEAFTFGIEFQSAGYPHCDICHVAERCRAVSHFDIGVQVACFTAADGLDKVLGMGVAAALAAQALFTVLEC